MKVLVTGGSGFIGSHVRDVLRCRGCEVVSMDRAGPTDFLGDVRDADAVSEAVQNADGVIHLAGVLGTQETVQNPSPAVTTNILGSLNVFEACARHRKRSVYIAVGNHWMLNPYSISKTCAERFALMYNAERGTEIAVVRGLNAYGPRQKAAPVRKIIPNFIRQALAGEDITIYGDGSQRMDMIYVEDLANILALALLNDHGCFDSVMEAGTGVAPTVNEIAASVISACGSSSGLHHVPMRAGEKAGQTVVADTETLAPLGDVRSLLRSLDAGLVPTVEWYR